MLAGRPGDRRLDRLQIYSGRTLRAGNDSGGVAYLAHVGGAFTGIVVAFLFMDKANYVKARNSAFEGWSVYEHPIEGGS